MISLNSADKINKSVQIKDEAHRTFNSYLWRKYPDTEAREIMAKLYHFNFDNKNEEENKSISLTWTKSADRRKFAVNANANLDAQMQILIKKLKKF